MKLQFTFKHLDHSQALQEYTQHRLEDVSQFLLKEGLGQVYFSKTKSQFSVEVTVNSRQKFFKATSSSLDIYEAVDAVAQKLEKQFLRIRKLHTNHKKFELSKGGKLRHLNGQLEYLPKYRKAA